MAKAVRHLTGTPECLLRLAISPMATAGMLLPIYVGSDGSAYGYGTSAETIRQSAENANGQV